MALDRRYVAAHRGEDRRLVSGARSDLEDPVARARREQLAHPGHDERLTDRLPRVDRECLVGVRVIPLPLVQEGFAGHAGHCAEHALVLDAPRAELPGDHRGSGFRGVHRLAGHGSNDTPQHSRGRPIRAAQSDQDGAGEALPGAVGAADGAVLSDGAADEAAGLLAGLSEALRTRPPTG